MRPANNRECEWEERSTKRSSRSAAMRKWIHRIGYTNFDANATATGIMGGLLDDEDGDGTSNGLEFYLGSDGTLVSSEGSLSTRAVDGAARLQIPVNGAAVEDGLAPTVQDSTNMTDWCDAGTTNSILVFESDSSSPGVSGIQEWEMLPGNDIGYFRLKLED